MKSAFLEYERYKKTPLSLQFSGKMCFAKLFNEQLLSLAQGNNLNTYCASNQPINVLQ